MGHIGVGVLQFMCKGGGIHINLKYGLKIRRKTTGYILLDHKVRTLAADQSEAEVLNKLSLAGLAKLSRLRYS